jgi:hypothetical protein
MKQNAHYRRLRSACSRESIRDTSALELLPGVHLVEAQREKRREKKEKKPERERERWAWCKEPYFFVRRFLRCAPPN